MRAVVWTGYESPDVLKLLEVDKPVPRKQRGEFFVTGRAYLVSDPELRFGEPAFQL